ncbi:WHG domain-containing protein [Frankia sp. Ag45/Mut15]|uniref:WHG domain-containing protein n=1 Tax=Frankia umida TaxID=573489 RepID=A0ABT0K4X6_9ACTN|nr:TetR-like C-terminal domain-containing protein [Frankia umida]MCK9878840.1 WHG domain-containing protein [Frankia umida]
MTAASALDDEQAVVRIKEAALVRLAVRRELNLDLAALAGATGVDPALARAWFPQSDDLLTALVLDAYAGMGAGAERGAAEAAAADGSPLDRWLGGCRGIRRWALDHPDEYTLIWGPPVPGYEAPPETMVVGARAVITLLTVLRDAYQAGSLLVRPAEPALSEGMARNVAGLAAGLLEGLPDPAIARMLTVWTQLHGMIGFEVHNHIAGVAADPAAFFDYAAESMGIHVGLTAQKFRS